MKSTNLLVTFFVLLLASIAYSVLYSIQIMCPTQLPGVIISIVYLLLFCIYYVRKYETSFCLTKTEFLFLIKSLLGTVLLYFLLNIISVPVVRNVMDGNFVFPVFSSVRLNDFFNSILDYTTYFIATILIAPITEEIIYRRFLQKYLLQKQKPIVAILISAIVFAFFHFHLLKFPSLFFMGCFSGIIYYKYNSLFVNILCHMLWNILSELLIIDNSAISVSFIIIYFIVALLFFFLMKSVIKDKTQNC